MDSLNITIFGGTGFVGRHLVARLRQEGHRLTLVSRHRPGDDPSMQDVEHHIGDLTKPETLERSLTGADVAINLVGAVKLPDADAYFALHEQGAAHVARLCRMNGVKRLIHFSAMGVSSRAPSSADRSKAAGETAVKDAYPAAVMLRPSLLYGPDDHLLALFEDVSRSTPVIPLFGASTRFQPLHVADICEAVVRLLSARLAEPSIYQAAGPEILTLQQIVALLCRSLGRRRLLLPLPDRVAWWAASVMERLPNAPFNRDQVLLMRTDKVALPELPTLAQLAIDPLRLDAWLLQRNSRRAYP